MLIKLFNDRQKNISGHNELFSIIPSSNFREITGGIRRLVYWATINPTIGVYRIDKGSGDFSPMIRDPSAEGTGRKGTFCSSSL